MPHRVRLPRERSNKDWPQYYAGNGGGNDTANSIGIAQHHIANPDVWSVGGAVQAGTGLDCRTVKYHFDQP